MNARTIRGWLLRQPRPALLRLTTGDGEPTELRPGRSFAKTAESIEALNPELIEALDDDGKLLRATNLREAEVASEDATVPPGLAGSPEAAMITHFANLLSRAYQHSTDVAFTKMVELVERMGDRADSIEARLERSESEYRKTVNQQIRDAFKRAEEIADAQADGDASYGEQLAGALLGGMGGMGAPEPPAKPNGRSRRPNGKAEQ